MNADYNIFKNKRFKEIILNPPDYKPGSFKGAGDLLIENGNYWLTSRTRTRDMRGYEVEIFLSKNGYRFKKIKTISIGELEKELDADLSSIEGQQLLYNRDKRLYYLYISVDFGSSLSHLWKTILMTSKVPSKDWKNMGVVIEPVAPFNTAKDFNISYINGSYIGICKAYIDAKKQLYAALFSSKDGIKWKYWGIPKINGKDQPPIFAIDGKIFEFGNKIIFLGSSGSFFKNGLTASDRVCGFEIDLKKMNFNTLFSQKWKIGSKYENPECPIHTYCTPVPDYSKKEWKIVIEAIDPEHTRKLGVFDVVDHVIMYTSKFNGAL